MFWTKKKQIPAAQSKIEVPQLPPLSPVEKLAEATEQLATSLSAYSETAYQASKLNDDEELIEAKTKVKMARELVSKGRIAYALGRCIPEHIKHWPSWSLREDFGEYVFFDAKDIVARRHEEETTSRTVKVSTIEFTFKGSRYSVLLRDQGMSYAPDTSEKMGEIELWTSDKLVAKFQIIENLMSEYSRWEYCDVLALRVGPWMKDIIDISVQIDTGSRKHSEDFINNRILDAARNIEL